ncbi:MAG: hypothetical protein FJY82_06150 [Candidatus Aminicenantes bacterium]|nr:hypothetical protein [Candidatus Aminicenantes bacterium]
MKPRKALVLIILLALGLPAGCRTGEAPTSSGEPGHPATKRHLDTAAPAEGFVRLAVFYPSTGTIRDLLALRAEGFLPEGGMEVVGVFHVRERTDYKAAADLVETNGLDWFHFHAVSADLGLETLYRENGATADFRKIFDLSDGVIFFGGPDLPPAAYGRKTGLQTRIEDPYRHYLELSASFHFLGGPQNDSFRPFLERKPDFPLLGICLGMQTFNAATGGTLVQDVWSDLYGARYVEDVIALGRPAWHTNPFRRLFPLDRELLPHMLHPIDLVPEGMFVSAMGFEPGDRPHIMSAHHQSPDLIGKGFRTAAVSLDGKVVEAIDHAAYPNVLGVQFHPEFRMLWETEPRYKISPEDQGLFGGRTYLERHPPSWAFHEKLWAWFFGKLKP